MYHKSGIIAFAVVMFILTAIIGSTVESMGGYGNPMYFLLWIMVGWFAYRNNLEFVFYLMKLSIWMAIGLVAFIYLFIGDNSNAITLKIKNSSVILNAIMLISQMGLYYYCSLKLKNSDGSNEDLFQKSSSASGNDKESKNNIKPEFVSYENSSYKMEQISSLNMKTLSDVDDVFYEKALEEYEKGRRKGLWIKILSTNEGNETKSKFEYIRVRAKEIQIEHAEFEKQQSILNETVRQEQIYKQLLLEVRVGRHKQIIIKGEDCFLLEDGKVLYKMKNGDYLIYKNETTMAYYLEFRQKSVGFVGVLKKDDALNIQKEEENIETVISVCRKCSLRLRVKNSTGMIKCPECGHSWLFEKQDSPFKPVNPKIENNSRRKTNLNLKDFLYKNVIMRLISLNYEYGFIFLVWIFSISILFTLVILIDDYFELGWI